MVLSIRNFSCSCACNSFNVKDFYCSCNKFSYDFTDGVYLLQGEIDCGAWAFVNAISPNCTKKKIYPEAEVFLDNDLLDCEQLCKITCYISAIPKVTLSNKNFLESIKRIAKKTKYEGTYTELFEFFKIPDYVIHKKVSELGIYYPVYLALCGLIKGKKIFTCTWQGQYGFDGTIIEKVVKGLEKENCIFIIPTTQKITLNCNYVGVNMLSVFDKQIQKKYTY